MRLPVAKIATNPHFSFITPEKFVKVAPSLATWGVGAGAALCLLGSDVPLMKKDILSKFPVVGSYWAVPVAESE